MAQKIVLDINKLERYLAKNQLGRVQPHAIGNNTIYCYDCLIGYFGEKEELSYHQKQFLVLNSLSQVRA